MPFRHTALALLGLAMIAATPSSAQTRVDQTCLVGGQRGTGQAPISVGCNIGRTPALSEFRFGFYNGDHRFRQATLMPAGDHFDAAWADQNSDDPWYIEARWLRVPEAQGGVVTAVVRGISDIPIHPGPPNTTLVLSGFEFKRADGTDNNIRTIAIIPNSADATIRTVLLDDQGTDFIQLGQAIGVGFAFGALGVPDPNMSFGATGVAESLFQRADRNRLQPGEADDVVIPAEQPPPAATPASGGPLITMLPGTLNPGLIRPVAQRHVEVKDNNARAYRVTVAYLWVPNNRLANTRTVSGGGRSSSPSDTSGTLPGQAPHVLHSFSFNFDNSDHFIGGFGVHLSGGAPVRGDEIGGDQVVTWEDANRDDPIRWTVGLSNLVDAPPVYRAVTPATARVVTVAPTTSTASSTTAPAESSPPASSSSEESSPPSEDPPRRRGLGRGSRGNN